MPRTRPTGGIMAKEDNLRPIRLSHDEATKNGRKGGLASVESRRRRKEMREFLNDYLDQEAVPHLKDWMRSHGVEDEDCCNLMALILAVFCKAMQGDIEAAKTIIQWAGMEPEQVEYMRLEQERSQAGIVSDRDIDGEEEKSDVIIYKPANRREQNEDKRTL